MPWRCLQGEVPDEATIQKLIRKGTLENKFVPVVCGSAFKNKGVQPLLDAVLDYLPYPVDIEGIKVAAEEGEEEDKEETPPFPMETETAA